MPIVPISPSTRTHSWLAVYFRSSGFTRAPPDVSRRRPLVERRRNDARGRRPAADVHLELGPDGRGAGRQERQPDRPAERRRVGPGRHDAGAGRGLRGVAVPGDPPVGHLESDELARYAGRLLRDERLAADELALRGLDDPAEVRLVRGD